jgi:redox-sensing transcriptional repressor
MSARAIPPATVARLPSYRRALLEASARGVRTIASAGIAEAVGVHPDQVRKDLSYLATRGTRGVGYDVRALVDETARILGLTEERAVVLVGAGNLGRALAAYEGFAPQGFRLAAVLDVDARVVGRRIGVHTVGHLDELAAVVARERITMGAVTVPAEAAQAVVDAMVAVGLTAVLNFAPVHLRVPPEVAVRRVDLSTELQMLSFHHARSTATATATS